jgi:hypothetical protein
MVLTHLHLHQHQQQHLLQLQILEPRVSIFLFSTAVLFFGRLPFALLVLQFSAAFSSLFTSVISRESNSFYFNPVQCLDSHTSTLVNYFVYSVLIPVIVHYLILLFDFYSFCSIFVFIRIFCSLFVIHKKYSVLILDFIPGILIPLNKNHHHLCKLTNIIHPTAPSLS